MTTDRWTWRFSVVCSPDWRNLFQNSSNQAAIWQELTGKYLSNGCLKIGQQDREPKQINQRIQTRVQGGCTCLTLTRRLPRGRNVWQTLFKVIKLPWILNLKRSTLQSKPSLKILMPWNRVTNAEQRISALEDDFGKENMLVKELSKKVSSLCQQVDNLESCIRRNNIRIIGLKEGIEADDMIGLLGSVFQHILGENEPAPEVDCAPCSSALSGPGGSTSQHHCVPTEMG